MIQVTRRSEVPGFSLGASQSPPGARIAVHPPRWVAGIGVVGHGDAVAVIITCHVRVQGIPGAVAVHVLVGVGDIGSVCEVHRMREQYVV